MRPHLIIQTNKHAVAPSNKTEAKSPRLIY